MRGYLSADAPWCYLIALGSNRRHARYGSPRRVLAAALERLSGEGLRVIAAARVIETLPLGPSIRRYANSAAVIETALEPEALLALLKRIERAFGRRASGQRWRARVLDLDVVLWSGGAYASARTSAVLNEPVPPERSRGTTSSEARSRAGRASLTLGIVPRQAREERNKGIGRSRLTIPHPLFRTRAFVLAPAVTIAPDWRDPLTGLTLRQLHARLTRPAALPKRAAGKGP